MNPPGSTHRPAAGGPARRQSSTRSPDVTMVVTSTLGLQYAISPHCVHMRRTRCSVATKRSTSTPPHWLQKRGVGALIWVRLHRGTGDAHVDEWDRDRARRGRVSPPILRYRSALQRLEHREQMR